MGNICKVFKVNTSHAITIPMTTIKALQIQKGDYIEINIEKVIKEEKQTETTTTKKENTNTKNRLKSILQKEEDE